MLCERPLGWLFVIATVVVDWVLLTSEGDGLQVAALRTGFLLGQLATVAIWTVRGSLHRLARISCLVIATAVLTFLTGAEPESMSAWLAFNSGYVFFIALGATASRVQRQRICKQSLPPASTSCWHIPLIEFFGLTIVVAIISFGARFMDFSFLQQRPPLFLIALTAVPLTMAVIISSDLRRLRGRKAVLLATMVTATAICLGRLEAGGEYLVFAQAAYLAMALSVLAMEDVVTDEKIAPSLPGLFQPQD